MTFTLTLTLLAAVMGLALGTLLAMMRLSRFKLLSVPAGIYVNVMRSIPLLLVIFWFYFLVPYMAAWALGSPTPVRVGAFNSAVITFTLFEAAYFCEIMRAGIQSISRGQVSAGLALGLSPWQGMLRAAAGLQHDPGAAHARHHPVPGYVAGVCAVADGFLGAASKIGQRDGRLVELYLFVALVYFLICFTASRLVKRLEKRARVLR